LRADFERNHERFVSDLQALDGELRQRLAGKQQRHFMVFHTSWAISPTPTASPRFRSRPAEGTGPQTLARLIDEAKRRQIRVIFVQQQFSRREAETVASAIGGEVLAVDPLAPDYLANLRRVGETFARVLQ
jgi:zinc transport system substrate-binding protein